MSCGSRSTQPSLRLGAGSDFWWLPNIIRFLRFYSTSARDRCHCMPHVMRSQVGGHSIVAVLCACLITLYVNARSLIVSKTSHFVLFRQVLPKQGFRSRWAVAPLPPDVVSVFCIIHSRSILLVVLCRGACRHYTVYQRPHQR